MATFHLTIKTGGAVKTGHDLAACLRDVAHRVDDDYKATAKILGAIKGADGVEVGRFEVDDWTEAAGECEGHEPDPADPRQPQGVTFYCDGTCRT